MIELHRKILGDSVRNIALTAALRRVVKPGDTVLDIGSGTGYLAFLARRLGAKQCILIESSGELLGLSKRLAKRNSIGNCRFIHAHSRDVTRDVRADVVISETLGNYALEEHLIETMEDAKRFLAPGGTLIPQQLKQVVAPVIVDRLQREIDIWKGIDPHLDFTNARMVSLQNMYVKTVQPEELLKAGDRTWDTLDFLRHEKSVRRGEVSWKIDESHTVSGFCLFWECTLVPGITLSTSPSAKPTHWEQIYLPLLEPAPMQAGDTLHLTLTSDTRHAVGVRVTWEVAIRSKGAIRASQRLDMKHGYMM